MISRRQFLLSSVATSAGVAAAEARGDESTTRRRTDRTWSKIVGEFITAHSAPVALREGVLYVRVLQRALHYELEQVSKIEVLQKLKTVSAQNHPRRPLSFRLSRYRGEFSLTSSMSRSISAAWIQLSAILALVAESSTIMDRIVRRASCEHHPR
jgi:Protein of unknown function (DUF721).